jgi:hypothetical protein
MKPYLNGAAHDELPAEGQEHVQLFWRMRAPTGRLLTCGLYHAGDELELRAGYAGDDPMWAETVSSEEVGVALAAAWKEVVVGKGGFVDLDPLH